MKQLYIIRGMKGVGRHMVAASLANAVYSAKTSGLADGIAADEWVYGRVKSMCERIQASNFKIAVVDVFSTPDSFQKYIDIGEKWGYTIHSIVVEDRLNLKPDPKMAFIRENFQVQI